MLYKGDPDTPTLTEAITVLYKYEFIKVMTQDIKELEQHGTWTIVSGKSFNVAYMIPRTWDFRVKHCSGGILNKLKARLCARGYRHL